MEMKMAVGAANWLLGKVLTKLSDPLVSAYMASSQLGSNCLTAKNQLHYTQGLLSASVGRDVGDDPGLHGLLGTLSKKADEAEDVLDELHYFMIQDEIYGTKWAAWEVGGCFKGHSIHGRHVARHPFGNCLPCFSCPGTQDDVKLPFNRVAMSKKIKSVIEEMNSICLLVSDLLKTVKHNITALSTNVTIERPPTSSTVPQDRKL